MYLKDLIKKPFWTPKDLSIATNISLSSARQIISKLRLELELQGYVNLVNSKVPTKFLIERLNIDIDWLSKVGGLDSSLDKE
jgi:hypothetical protein